MIRVPIAPAPGLVTDETGFSIPNRCIAADKVRWRSGKPEPIGGWVKYFASQLSGVCRAAMTWFDLDSRLNIALGTNSHIYVHVGGVLNDVTPAALAVGAIDGALTGSWGAGEYGDGYWGEGSVSSAFLRTWSLDNWGQNLIANPRGGTIYVWENVAADEATAITGAPAEVNTVLVTPEFQLLAFGCSEEVSGVFNPLAVRGSDIRNYSLWTTASNNNAFEDILSGGGSRLVNGLTVGEYRAAWTDEGLFMGTFIGLAGQTYQWDLQGVNCGLISPNAVVVVNKRAYWITPDLQFYTWAPGESPSAIPCPVRSILNDNLVTAQADKIQGCSIGQFGEIQWFYPDARDGSECSRYISFTTQSAVPEWSQGILARSGAVDAGAVDNPLFVSPDGYVYSHEDGNTADGGAMSGFYTVSLPYLDEGGRYVLVKGIEPDFLDQVGPVSFSFLMRKYPQDAGYAKGPFTVAVGQGRKHFMFQGRSGEMTTSWESSPARHRLGRPVLLGEVTGAE